MDHWREFRIRNRIAVLGLVLGLPGIAAIASLLKYWDADVAGAVFGVLMLLWAMAWGWSAFRLVRWPCPRCGKAWLSFQEPNQLVKRACANCGLSLYGSP